MPTYDYLCENCGHAFEKFESITANPAKKCPECKKMKLNRLIGAGAGIIFKGAGFYETDYRSDSYTSGKKKAQKKPAEKKAETKSEAKPKKETKPKTSTKKKSK